MPVSKNRKGHAKKAALRKQHIKEKKNHLENMYKEMMFQLKDKSVSVPDMLNKEDNFMLPAKPTQTVEEMYPVATSGYINANSPEEQAEQDDIQASAIITVTP